MLLRPNDAFKPLRPTGRSRVVRGLWRSEAPGRVILVRNEKPNTWVHMAPLICARRRKNLGSLKRRRLIYR